MDVSRRNLVVLIAAASVLSACTNRSLVPGPSPLARAAQGHNPVLSQAASSPECFQRTRHIVGDLVSAMAQLPALRPAHTTFTVPLARSRFEILLLERVQQAGYALRRQQTDERDGKAVTLRHSVHTDAPVDFADSTLRGVYFFTLMAGDVALRRAYRVSASGVRPASSLFVRGADASGVLLDDAVFGAGSPCHTPGGHGKR